MTPIKRKTIHDKYGGRCAYCGNMISISDMQVDHFKAKRNGGTDDISNLMPSCRRCNHYKRAGSLEFFRIKLKTLKQRVIDNTYLGKVAIDYGMVTWNDWDGQFYFEKMDLIL